MGTLHQLRLRPRKDKVKKAIKDVDALFEELKAINERNKKRVERERKRNNERTKRAYRL